MKTSRWCTNGAQSWHQYVTVKENGWERNPMLSLVLGDPVGLRGAKSKYVVMIITKDVKI